MNKRGLRRVILLVLCVVLLFISIWGLYVKSQSDKTGFVYLDLFKNKVIYKDKSGQKVYGLKKIKKNTYYFDEKSGYMQRGLVETKDGIMYFDKEGKMVKGLQEIDGDLYCFNKNGYMVKNDFARVERDGNSQISYFDKEGKMFVGTKKIDGVSRKFDEKGALVIDTSELKKGIQKIIDEYGIDVGFYYKDLSTSTTVSINDHNFYPGCMVKAPALGAVYQKIEAGELNEDDNWWYIYNMITISDNTCYNTLMQKIGDKIGTRGTAYVTEMCKSLGMEHTEVHHGLKPGLHYFGDGKTNTSRPSDIGIYFEQLYKGNIVGPEYTQRMLDLFNACRDVQISIGIPSGTYFPHKTGFADDYYHDGGIVYSENGEYILVIFTHGYSTSQAVNQIMGDLSYYTYNWHMKLLNLHGDSKKDGQMDSKVEKSEMEAAEAEAINSEQ